MAVYRPTIAHDFTHDLFFPFRQFLSEMFNSNPLHVRVKFFSTKQTARSVREARIQVCRDN